MRTHIYNGYINNFKEVEIMIGDVKTAEKKFRDLVGGRTNADTLLKRLSDAEAKNLKGQGIQSYLDSKLKGIRIILNDDNLDVLFGRKL